MDDLLDELAAGPADRDEALRVYADHRIAAGDSFGELIVVALTRSRGDTPELARREAALIDEQTAILDAAIDRQLGAAYTWRSGFIDAVALDFEGDRIFNAWPILARSPAARMLTRIEITAVQADGKGDLTPIIAELARVARWFPRLRELRLREGLSLGNPYIDGPIDVGDVSPVYAAFPRLAVLEVRGNAIEYGELVLPEIQSLALDVTMTDLRRLVAAHVPRLEQLELQIAGGRANIAATLGPLLHRELPRLTALRLQLAAELQPYVIDELAAAPLARHVTRLGLLELDDAGVERVLAHAAALRRFEQLELPQRLRAEPRRALKQAFGDRLRLG